MASTGVIPQAVLLDIEGTTTPISFVHEILFGYARLHGREFILSHLQDREVQQTLEELRAANKQDLILGAPAIGSAADLDNLVDYYLWLIAQDRKSTPLKTIQGRIWQDGYTRGELRSVVFSDVRPAFESLHQRGCRIAIYSSGSALAQELLFRYSTEGDLTRFIHAYFDTRVGHKREAESYTKIASQLNLPPMDILFVSDTVEELNAARAAGMGTNLCVRPGNSPRTGDTTHPTIESFDCFFEPGARLPA